MADGQVVYEVRADDSKLDGDLDSAQSKVKGSSSKIAGIAKTAGVAVAGAVLAVGVAAVKFGSEFETSMAGASTLFGEVAVDTENLNDKMLELSSQTGISATEMGDALYSALSAGIPASEDMSESLAVLESSANLAKAGFTDIDTALSATVSTMNAYGMGVEETDRVQKILMQTQNKGITTVGELGASLSQVTPMAASMGVSFENVGASLATLTAQGTSTAQATTQLNSLLGELGKSGTAAAGNLAKAAEGTDLAGMSFTEMMDSGANLNEVLNMMGDYAADSDLQMVDMFSSLEAGSAAVKMAGEHSDMFTDSLAAMGTEADVVGEAMEKVTGTTAERFGKMTNELKNMAIELFLSMAPLIEEILPILSDLLNTLLPPIMNLAETIMPMLVELFTSIAEPLGELMENLMPPLIELFNQIVPPLLELMEEIMPVLVELFNALLPPLMDLLGSILPPLIDVFKALIPPIMEIIEALLPPFIELINTLSPLMDALSPIISALATIIGEVLSAAIEVVMPVIESLMDILGGLITFITGVFTGDWSMAWSGIVSVFKGIFNLIPSIVEGVLNAAISIINAIIRGINSVSGSVGIKAIGQIGKVSLPRFKTGKDRIPYDEFPALLDKDEMVLTAKEADTYRHIMSKSTAIEVASTTGATNDSSMNYLLQDLMAKISKDKEDNIFHANINFNGELSALAKVLTPEITITQNRNSKSAGKTLLNV